MTVTEHQRLKAGALKPGLIVMRATMLTIACIVSFWLVTHILARMYFVSRADDLLGGMWAVVSTIFVYRYSQAESFQVALSRMSATIVSFALCLIYLLIFPFHILGMAVLIGIGAIAVALIGRTDDTITTSITTAVVLVVAATRGPEGAWLQPILRLVDTAIGVTVGVAAAWLCERAMQSIGHNHEFRR
ncbi:MAG: FUSC family protein [Acidobacteriia bacterium]|nr:FUSC family protein [Terriglobia bacterium]MBV8905113.1 FUSC family protein [Terriglobia bacterium]MBV9745531.1 FUSC family protein [Terriglobia bacterium]